jgi:hypothetical protein
MRARGASAIIVSSRKKARDEAPREGGGGGQANEEGASESGARGHPGPADDGQETPKLGITRTTYLPYKPR